jgi:hypothetical protein
MSALSIQPPYPAFADADGQPLENGYIFIGAANLNPIVNPIAAFFDAALTIPAVQPIRTSGGYPVYQGTPANIYVNSDYSIQVQNKNGSVVYSAPAATERYSEVVFNANASQVIYDPAGLGAVQTTVQAKLRESVSVLDFGADPTGATDSTAAFQAAVNMLKTVVVPEGTYNITTVAITMQGCEIVMHQKAYLVVSGFGIQREIQQVTRAAYIAANSTIDGYNYYDTLKVSGGNIILGANANGITDRIPFLQYIGAPPTPSNPNGLQPFKTPMLVSNVAFILQQSTSLGIGIHGGWGSIVENCTFTGYDCGKAIYINGDGTFNPSSQPQLITIQDNSFNSCTPIDAVKGTCTNSCEGLNILGNKFSFVQAITLNAVNAANIIGNYIIFNEESMRIVDSGGVVLNANYLQVAQQHTTATHECVVSFVNSSRATVTDNYTVIDNLANNRSGFGFYTNTSNSYFSIQVSDNTFSKGLTGGSAVTFAASTAPFTFENVNISNIIAPYFSYVVNFFNVIGADARNVSIRDLFTEIGDGTIAKVVAINTVDFSTIDAPQFYQKEKLSLRSSANNSGVAGECMVYALPTTVLDPTFTTLVTNFVNTSNCVSITAANNSGSIRVVLGQNATLATGAIVSGTADLEIYGDII